MNGKHWIDRCVPSESKGRALENAPVDTYKQKVTTNCPNIHSAVAKIGSKEAF